MDSHATTPVDPRVVEAMLPFFMAEVVIRLRASSPPASRSPHVAARTP